MAKRRKIRFTIDPQAHGRGLKEAHAEFLKHFHKTGTLMLDDVNWGVLRYGDATGAYKSGHWGELTKAEDQQFERYVWRWNAAVERAWKSEIRRQGDRLDLLAALDATIREAMRAIDVQIRHTGAPLSTALSDGRRAA